MIPFLRLSCLVFIGESTMTDQTINRILLAIASIGLINPGPVQADCYLPSVGRTYEIERAFYECERMERDRRYLQEQYDRLQRERHQQRINQFLKGGTSF
jgi:hypothetical protein